MDGWMDSWVDGWMHASMHAYMHAYMRSAPFLMRMKCQLIAGDPSDSCLLELYRKRGAPTQFPSTVPVELYWGGLLLSTTMPPSTVLVPIQAFALSGTIHPSKNDVGAQ